MRRAALRLLLLPSPPPPRRKPPTPRGSAPGCGTDRAVEAVGGKGGSVVEGGEGGASPGELFGSLARAGVRIPREAPSAGNALWALWLSPSPRFTGCDRTTGPLPDGKDEERAAWGGRLNLACETVRRWITPLDALHSNLPLHALHASPEAGPEA
ncbi:hypothetical protein T484DRAFT_1895534, partial [Baffinella frigidus]